jgi:hypothetical protein
MVYLNVPYALPSELGPPAVGAVLRSSFDLKEKPALLGGSRPGLPLIESQPPQPSPAVESPPAAEKHLPLLSCALPLGNRARTWATRSECVS